MLEVSQFMTLFSLIALIHNLTVEDKWPIKYRMVRQTHQVTNYLALDCDKYWRFLLIMEHFY